MRYIMIPFSTSDFKFYPSDGLKPFPNLHDQEDLFHKGDYFTRGRISGFNH